MPRFQPIYLHFGALNGGNIFLRFHNAFMQCIEAGKHRVPPVFRAVLVNIFELVDKRLVIVKCVGMSLIAELVHILIFKRHIKPQKRMKAVLRNGIQAFLYRAIRHCFNQFVPRFMLFVNSRIMALINQPCSFKRIEFIPDTPEVFSDILGIDKSKYIHLFHSTYISSIVSRQIQPRGLPNTAPQSMAM